MFNQPPYPQGYSPTAAYGYAGAAEQRIPGFMARVFGWMTVGLGLTGVVAFLTAHTSLVYVMDNPIAFIAVFLVSLALVFVVSAARLPASIAALLFLAYSVLTGLWVSGIFLAYTSVSIERTFIVTAGTFAIMAIIGFTTKIDLTRFGSLLFMALIGIILASVVNFFLGSSVLYYVVTYLGIAIFVGLTAYDTQRLKRLAAASGTSGGLAIRGALMLYLDFLNLFLFLLRILGRGNN